MTILFEIPLLENTTDQTLDVEISNEPYTLRVLWNEKYKYASLSIFESDGFSILDNIKMVNNFPLVQRFKKTRFVGDFYLIRRDGKDSMPTDLETLSRDFALIYYDAELPPSYPSIVSPIGFTQTVWDNGNTIWRDEFGEIVNWI